ncbi:MAG: phosphatidylglycerophosphatase A [Thermodesulfobacteriota bacterium]
MRLIMAVATGFSAGYLPVAPGTWGSLLGLPLHWLLTRLPLPLYAAAVAVLIVVAVLAAGGAEKILDRKDPGVVVIDEVAGMVVTMVGAPQVWWAYVAGFLLFRLFDIVKPFPARWCDRHLNGGFGIVLDDLVAGVYAMLCLQLGVRWAGL